MPHYNLALLPETCGPELVTLAESFKHTTNTDYLLGEHSLPHITLAQFSTENSAILNQIEQEVTLLLTETSVSKLTLHLNGPHWKFDRKREGFIWLALLPADEPSLFRLHEDIVTLLQGCNLTPRNQWGNDFEPHLTVAHLADLSYIAIELPIKHIKDEFYLALGESDEIGQFKRILKKFELNMEKEVSI